MEHPIGRLTEWVRTAITPEGDALAPYLDRIMLLMGSAMLVLLFPFTINHFVQGRWPTGLILLSVDTLIALNVNAVWRERPMPIRPVLLLVPQIAGVTMALVVQGVPGLLWIYPVIVYSYFITSRRIAIFCSLAMLIYFPVLVFHYIDPLLAPRVFASLLLTIVLINIALSVIADLHKILANQALTDPLTGAYNRRYMNEYLEALVSRAQRHPLVASLLMIDADHFKPINDELGHDQGDRVLQQIVQIIGKRLRQGDKLFRCGGEEFVLVLEDTNAAGAIVVAEDIRHNIEAAAILPSRPVTVSIGVSQFRSGQTADEWIKTGDLAMYQAKAGGRNRIEVAFTTPVAMPPGRVETALSH